MYGGGGYGEYGASERFVVAGLFSLFSAFVMAFLVGCFGKCAAADGGLIDAVGGGTG